MRILVVPLLCLFSCSHDSAVSEEPIVAVAEELDGAVLFAQNCALCHGPKGDGEGVVQTERKARNFVDGGFSFGNTYDALFRTISTGIGGTAMPGFGETLDKDQIDALVEVVQGFAPASAEVKAEDTVLVVKDTPLVVRGHLPSLSEGGPDYPRGLLVGHTDGLSYEYRADDLCLLAVRQGDFVERTDWGGRGGTPLKPLGRVAWIAEEHSSNSQWRIADYDGMLKLRLIKTKIVDNQVWVYGLLDSNPASATGMHEIHSFGLVAMSANLRSNNLGFERIIRFTSFEKDRLVQFKGLSGWVDIVAKKGSDTEIIIREKF